MFNMHGSGKELTHHRKGKTSSTTKRIASRHRATFQSKIGNKSHRRLQHNTTRSVVFRKKVGKCVSKGVTTGCLKRKLAADTFPQEIESNKKQCTLNIQGGKLPVNRSEKMVNQAKADGKSKHAKKRKKRIVGNANAEPDEAGRLQRRTRYLLIKLKLEQNFIDAYSGEGWKGQSREKIKPDKELQRAKKQILKFKLGIRDAIRQLDMLSSVGCIEESAVAPDGSVYHEHIICAKCKLREASPDNDIILCDGTCNCAFHQKCLDPPLLTENIPPEDQGWLCKFCECKMEILEAMNAHIGTHFSPDSQWQDIFKEEADFAVGGMDVQNTEQDWPSEDSEDDDYDPEKIENSCSFSGTGSKTDPSDDASSSSSLWSLEGEVLSESEGQTKQSSGKQNTTLESPTDDGYHEAADCELLCGPRQRKAVDYTQLYAEMFGKDAPVNEQISEDEDWGPAKRKKREKESDAACTLMTLSETDTKFSHENTKEGKLKVPSEQCKRSLFRIPRTAVEKLRLAFSENELPSRSTRENLSKQLGLDREKVNKWFKNARYMALKLRKAVNVGQNGSAECAEEFRSKIVEEDNCPDASASKDILSGTRHSKEVQRRTKRKSLASSLNKKTQSRSLDSNKGVQEEFDDDNVSLKLFKAFAKSKKKIAKFNQGGGGESEVEETAAEADMERILKIEGRMEKLREVLSHRLNRRISNKTNIASSTIISSPSVVYVPEAVLREKK